MGDTLTHLPNKSDVSALFGGVFDRLRPGGKFVITCHDLTTELYGTNRFIPIRSDDNNIMTCFLEFENADSVVGNLCRSEVLQPLKPKNGVSPDPR